MPGVPRGLGPLRHRGFRLLAGGQLASNLGDALYAVALPWYVLAGQGGVLLLGTVLAAYGIPRTALLAVGGHASDRWRPWTVMMAADTLRAVAVAVLAVAAISGRADPYLLVPIAAVLGAGEGLFLPGSFAIVPALLPGEDLQAGTALTEGGTQLATLAGPAVGGVIVATLGASPAFALDAASFVVSAVTLSGVRFAQRPARPTVPSQLEAAPAEAATLRRLVASQRVLQVLLLVAVAANLGSGGLSEVALPALAHGPFHAGADGYGGLIAAFGGGALVGTIVAAQTRRARRPAIVASVAFVAEAGFLAAVPYLGGTLPAAGALVAFGALNGFGNVVMVTAFQRWAPAELMGRLMGLLLLAGFGVFPLSVILGGLVVHTLGPAAFFPLAATVLAAAVLAGLSQHPWRAFGATDAADHLSPAGAQAEGRPPTYVQPSGETP
ncbi:MAG: MFS transporter [Acidimicrobiales bacterium]